MTSETLIRVKNLSRFYGDYGAVNNISFDLATGDILGFLGPNGAGKSTTMQMLTGNLAPSEGEIQINGYDLLEKPKAAKTSLGYLPEVPPLYQEMTVYEFLYYCSKLHRIVKNRRKHCIETAMQHCGLEDVSQRLIRNLSKGYQQRTGIAQAILHSPPVIILDEPTVGLDPIQIMEIRNLIKQLGKNHGIILCTHILPEVQAVCTRVQIMNRGQLVYEADTASFQQSVTDWFEISLQQPVDIENILSINDIKQAKKTGGHNYLVQSSLAPEILCQRLVEQSWGVSRFCPHQPTLEQKFIELSFSEKPGQ